MHESPQIETERPVIDPFASSHETEEQSPAEPEKIKPAPTVGEQTRSGLILSFCMLLPALINIFQTRRLDSDLVVLPLGIILSLVALYFFIQWLKRRKANAE